MGRPRLLAATVAALALSLSAAALAGPSEPTTPANAKPYPSAMYAATYKVFDSSGRLVGKAKWHWTPTGGNCCEVYIASTSTGGLLEYGGSYPYTSADHGRHWQQIASTTPLYNGEGAIVAGPHRNVYGISWDPYTGDHLQGVRYTSASGKWEVAEAVLKTPVFDREWITYAKGPFVDPVTHATAPFLTLVRGGTTTKNVAVIATDGVSYTTPTDAHLDVQRGPEPRLFRIPVVRNPDADWWQPNPGTYTLPLSGGGLLLLNNGDDDLGAPAAWLNPTTLKWERVRLAFSPTGTIRQDSRGWLTMVTRQGGDLTLALSRDGGKTWTSTPLVLPSTVSRIEGSGNFFDVKVDGALGQAVVSTRADTRNGLGQDVVWRVDVRHAQPAVLKVYAVGLGDINTVIGVSVASSRFDFPSVALLPDGRIAVSFDDSTTPRHHPVPGVPATSDVLNPTGHSPALAILD